MSTCEALPDLQPLPGQRRPEEPTGDPVLGLARQGAVRSYGPRHGEDLVGDCFDAAAARYRDARVRAFVPLLVERRLREVLRGA